MECISAEPPPCALPRNTGGGKEGSRASGVIRHPRLGRSLALPGAEYRGRERAERGAIPAMVALRVLLHIFGGDDSVEAGAYGELVFGEGVAADGEEQ